MTLIRRAALAALALTLAFAGSLQAGSEGRVAATVGGEGRAQGEQRKAGQTPLGRAGPPRSGR